MFSGEEKYIFILTTVALGWMAFFIWFVTFATSIYLNHVTVNNVNSVIKKITDPVQKEKTIKEANKTDYLQISRFSDYRDRYSYPSSKKYICTENSTTIDFLNPLWKEQYRCVKSHLPAVDISKNEKVFMDKWNSSGGYSTIIHTAHYAIVTNACINLKNDAITIHLQDDTILSSLVSKYKHKDFFFNYVRVLKTPLLPSKLLKKPQHLLVIHPQTTANRYNVLEGSSMLSYVATHLTEFPNLEHLLVLGDHENGDIEYNTLLLNALTSLFPSSHPIHLISKDDLIINNQQHVCDRIITFVRDWQEDGGGTFFPSLLSVNLLRGSIYHYNYYTIPSLPSKLHAVLLQRSDVRRILNAEAFLTSVQTQLHDYIQLISYHIASSSFHQTLHMLMYTDMMISSYGSELLYSLFMLPNSAVIELYPPFWDWSHYKRFSLNIGLLHVAYKAKGERDPICLKRPKSNKCLIMGTRDRDFSVNVDDMVLLTNKTIARVFKKKYACNWFSEE